MSNTVIHVDVKRAYGVVRFFPRCENAKAFAKLAGTKTLTRDTLEYLKELGYTIQQHHPEQEEIEL